MKTCWDLSLQMLVPILDDDADAVDDQKKLDSIHIMIELLEETTIVNLSRWEFYFSKGWFCCLHKLESTVHFQYRR